MLTMTRTRLIACACVLGIFIPAFADKPHTSRELLLPHFQVAVQGQAQDTQLTLGNSAATDLMVDVEIFTNWGISVFKFQISLGPRQIRHFNMADLINKGHVPDNPRLIGGSLNRLREALCGHNTTLDGMYFGSETQPGCAVGFVRFSVAGDKAPYLWGRYTLMDEDGGMVANNPLINVDMADPTHETCKRHGMRTYFEGMQDVDAQMVIWTDVQGNPTETAAPQTRKALLSAWDEDGRFIRSWNLDLMASNRIDLDHYFAGPDPCWFELTTDVEAHMALQMEDVCDELEIHAWCLSSEGLRIEKTTNGHDADVAPGPEIPVGSVVTWRYTVSNLDDDPIYDILVTDDQGVQVDCPKDSLQPGESMTCTASARAEACQYANLGMVTGVNENGTVFRDEDPSHYYGAESPGIRVEKYINGLSCNDLPGNLEPGPVTWSYEVTNTGNVALNDVTLTDAEIGLSNGLGVLQPKETRVYFEMGYVSQGEHVNTAEVRGVSVCGTEVSDRDSCRYCFGCAKINLEKFTNDVDADQAPGPLLERGSEVTWTYVVVNNGTVTLNNVTVTDITENHTFPPVTLAPGEAHSFRLTGSAECGLYRNQATATGVSEAGETVRDTDFSHYTGRCGPEPLPGVILEKRTNGEDTGQGPGPTLNLGDPVTWTYTVINPDDPTKVDLVNVTVFDEETGKTFGPVDLPVGTSHTFTDTGTAVCGPYSNTAVATGQVAGSAATVTDSDTSHYFGSCGSIDLEKATNGVDADVGPGPTLQYGDEVTWTYVVTNTGNGVLDQVTVVDQTEQVTFGPVTLQPGDQQVFTHKGTAICGSYANTAVVTGVTQDGSTVTDSDTSHYVGTADVGLSLVKRTNGEDVAAAPGPTLNKGDQVVWTYEVTNTGATPLSGVQVTDITESKRFAPFNLAAGESKTLTHTGVAECGQYSNMAVVTALDVCGNEIQAQDNSYYYVNPVDCAAIDLEKATNGVDADLGPGPVLEVGDEVTWTYLVINTGSEVLEQVTVVDQTEQVSFGPVTLQPGARKVFTHKGTAVCGNYTNTAAATGKTQSGDTVTDTDVSHYTTDVRPGLDLEKATNGVDADTAPGPTLIVGDTVTWTYTVTNTGNVRLENIVVTDVTQGHVFSPVSLNPGDTYTHTLRGTAVAGQYSNTAVAEAVGPCGQAVSDTDLSHYTAGCDSGLDLEFATNGMDADIGPGPMLQHGNTVTWTYTVTNTGNTKLTEVTVTDPVQNKTFGPFSLNPGQTRTFTHTGTVECGPYGAVAEAKGKDPCGACITDVDPSHHTGVSEGASIDLETAINGHDADLAPGVKLDMGQSYTLSCTVTNNGTVTLTNVMVIDQTNGKTYGPLTLQPGQSQTYNHNDTVSHQNYQNTAVAHGTAPCGNQVSDNDPSYYHATPCESALVLEKATNGIDADVGPGPTLQYGDTVTWTYTVTNTGNTKLTEVTVTDPVQNKSFGPFDLNPGQTRTFTHTGTVECGPYGAIAEAKGKDPCDACVTDTDPSHHTGVSDGASIDLETAINGNDADSAPGVQLQAGQSFTFSYTVTNNGTVTLSNVMVIDQTENTTYGPITLQPGGSQTFSRQDTVRYENYANTTVAHGTAPCGDKVDDEDPSHYYTLVCESAIRLEKATNGRDADTAPGPTLQYGDPVTWTYEVTNTGADTLTNVIVTDPRESKTFGPFSLAPGQSKSFSHTGTVQCGPYSNTAQVTALNPCSIRVNDTDSSHYTGVSDGAHIDVETAIDGVDADLSPGVRLEMGKTFTLTCTVVNDGSVPLTNVMITDQTHGVTHGPMTLQPGQVETFTHDYPVDQQNYRNITVVEGVGPCGERASDSEESHYYTDPCEPAIDVEKYTNGKDSDRAPGQSLVVGSEVTWTYVVTNTGDCVLNDVTVYDYREDVNLGPVSLQPGASHTFEHRGIVKCGKYSNKAKAQGFDSSGKKVEDSDWSHYKGVANPKIDLEKYTNGEDADKEPGPKLTPGQTVIWTYVVTNTGNTPLYGVTVRDETEKKTFGPVDLAPGESQTFTLQGVAENCSGGDDRCIGYKNKGVAKGKDACGKEVCDVDWSHYYCEKGDDDDDDEGGDRGCSPGYWKNHAEAWMQTPYDRDDKLSAYFPAIKHYWLIKYKTLKNALYFGGGSSTTGAAKKLLSHAVPALLNAAHPEVDYPMSEGDILTEVNEALDSKSRNKMLELKNRLDKYNNAGCPLN